MTPTGTLTRDDPEEPGTTFGTASFEGVDGLESLSGPDSFSDDEIALVSRLTAKTIAGDVLGILNINLAALDPWAFLLGLRDAEH